MSFAGHDISASLQSETSGMTTNNIELVDRIGAVRPASRNYVVMLTLDQATAMISWPASPRSCPRRLASAAVC